jgi:hypothetical protein
LQTKNSKLSYLPDAEETKHMIDAEGVEILGHLEQTLTPPQETILAHLVPVVRGEAPVLAIGGESIGRCASLMK